MKLVGVEINNYKSFGEENNFLFLDNLNIIIGKNESGKSNIIDALSNIKTLCYTPEDYFEYKNRKNRKDINIVLHYETYKQEIKTIDFNGNAIITLNGYNDYNIEGDLAQFIKNHELYNTTMDRLNEMLDDEISFSKSENYKLAHQLVEQLNMADQKLFIEPDNFSNFISILKNSSTEGHEEFALLLEKIVNFLEEIYSLFPTFIKIENLSLKTRYSSEEIECDELLEQLFSICKIDSDEVIQKLHSEDISDVRNFENEINFKLKEFFTDKFNEFYNQENISLEMAIHSGELIIMVDTTNRYLDYDERSNGLKWYINAFIQLLYLNKYNNSIILMDEPGVYLHANAQKELIDLFDEITKKETQIIYTTHSPFMINLKCLQNIRTVIKNEDGYSSIYNKITTIPTKSPSTFDTITPLAYSMGLDINYNLGPNLEKTNIIVEGITDYFYLHGYYKQNKIKNIPNIIPATGADNVIAIASILFGWGCDFKILLDQDAKGRSIYDKINDTKQPFIDKLLFVDGSHEKNKKENMEIEDILSPTDKTKFGITNDDYNTNKYNYAYITYNKILQNEENYDTTTLNNFKNILKK